MAEDAKPISMVKLVSTRSKYIKIKKNYFISHYVEGSGLDNHKGSRNRTEFWIKIENSAMISETFKMINIGKKDWMSKRKQRRKCCHSRIIENVFEIENCSNY